MKALRVLAISVCLSTLVMVAALGLLAADRFLPFRLPQFLAPLGWPLMIAGALLIMVALVTFLTAAGASGAVGDAPARLVTSGPFRYLRNPIYVGAGLELFGIALRRQSPSFLLVALLFLPGIDIYVRRVEEPRLRARFGDEYLLYQRAVRRWMPSWPGRR